MTHAEKMAARREKVRKLVLDGLSNQEIGERIGLAAESVSELRRRIGLPTKRGISLAFGTPA